MTLLEIGCIGALPGFFVGAGAAWIFTFQYFMPYVHVAEAWSFAVGVLLYLFVFLGLGTAIGTFTGFAVAVVVTFSVIACFVFLQAAIDFVRKALTRDSGNS